MDMKSTSASARGTQKRKSQWVEEDDRNADKRNGTMRTEYKKRKVRNLMDNAVLHITIWMQQSDTRERP